MQSLHRRSYLPFATDDVTTTRDEEPLSWEEPFLWLFLEYVLMCGVRVHLVMCAPDKLGKARPEEDLRAAASRLRVAAGLPRRLGTVPGGYHLTRLRSALGDPASATPRLARAMQLYANARTRPWTNDIYAMALGCCTLVEAIDAEDEDTGGNHTLESCPLLPNVVRWQGKTTRLEGRLWHLLGLILNARGKPVPFDQIEEKLFPSNENVTSKHVANAVSALNCALRQIGWPYTYKTKLAHVLSIPSP